MPRAASTETQPPRLPLVTESRRLSRGAVLRPAPVLTVIQRPKDSSLSQPRDQKEESRGVTGRGSHPASATSWRCDPGGAPGCTASVLRREQGRTLAGGVLQDSGRLSSLNPHPHPIPWGHHPHFTDAGTESGDPNPGQAGPEPAPICSHVAGGPCLTGEPRDGQWRPRGGLWRSRRLPPAAGREAPGAPPLSPASRHRARSGCCGRAC